MDKNREQILICELKSCCAILKDFAENNFSQNVWHKVICAKKLSELESILKEEFNYERNN